jgi:hypothetical protein
MGGLILCLGLVVITVGLILVMDYSFDRIVFLQFALIFGGGVLVLLIQRPQVMFALLLVGGILVKWEIGSGTQSALNGAILVTPALIAVCLVHLVFHRESQRPLSSRAVIPIFLFMIAACLAFLVGQYPWFPAPPAPLRAQLGQLAVFLFSGGLFLGAAYQLQDIRWLKRITYLFIGVGSIYLISQVLPSRVFRLSGFLPDAVARGSMFWTWLVAVSFGQAVMNRELGRLGRLVMAIVALTSLAIGLSTPGWVSGWAPGLLSVSVVLFLRFPTPFLVAMPILAVLALSSASYFTGLVATTGDNLYSYETRTAAIRSLLPILSANPVLGLGPANYYHYTLLTPIEGWYVKFNSHNNYVDLIAQTGLVGLTCFLWFAWAVGRTAWGLQYRSLTGFQRGYICSVLGGLLATLVAAFLGDWIVPFVYNTGFAGFRTSIIPWIFMGGLIALEQQLARRT